MIFNKLIFHKHFNIGIRLFTRSSKFKLFQNFEKKYINIPVSKSGLISSVYKPLRMQCITLCSTNTNCLTAMYDNRHNKLNNCFTYSKYFQSGKQSTEY
jgi:hypothetical protein